jgi:hypothetical protein
LLSFERGVSAGKWLSAKVAVFGHPLSDYGMRDLHEERAQND